MNMPNFYQWKKIFSSSYLLVDIDFPSTSFYVAYFLCSSTHLSHNVEGIHRGVPQALSPSPLGKKQVIITANIIGQFLENKRNISSTQPATDCNSTFTFNIS